LWIHIDTHLSAVLRHKKPWTRQLLAWNSRNSTSTVIVFGIICLQTGERIHSIFSCVSGKVRLLEDDARAPFTYGITLRFAIDAYIQSTWTQRMLAQSRWIVWVASRQIARFLPSLKRIIEYYYRQLLEVISFLLVRFLGEFFRFLFVVYSHIVLGDGSDNDHTFKHLLWFHHSIDLRSIAFQLWSPDYQPAKYTTLLAFQSSLLEMFSLYTYVNSPHLGVFEKLPIHRFTWFKQSPTLRGERGLTIRLFKLSG